MVQKMPNDMTKNNMLLLRNAQIVGGTQDRPSDPVDVVIENGYFREVGKDLAFHSAPTLDLAGKTLMPGLIDCHVHVVAASANLGANAAMPNSLIALEAARIMRGMLNRGFTTVRDLGGADIGLKMALERGLIEGPNLIICGKALSQSGGHTDYRGAFERRPVDHYVDQLGALGRIVDGVAEVQRAARDELRCGAEFIKVMADGGVSSPSDPIGYLVFSEAELKAMVSIAKGFGTYVSAHVYDDAAIVRALDCGIECLEHANLISDATIARVAGEGQFVVPTNITYELLSTDGEKFGLLPASVAKIDDVRSAGLDRLIKLHEAGVVTGYGTDLLGGMHDYQSGEFELRARYLPTWDVIRSATLDAAKVLRKSGQIGEIVAGASADFIVVEGNPLSDITLLTAQGAHMSVIGKAGRVVKNSIKS